MECEALNLKKIVMISGDIYENVELVTDVPEEIKSISEDLIGIRQGTDLIWINKTLIDSLLVTSTLLNSTKCFPERIENTVVELIEKANTIIEAHTSYSLEVSLVKSVKS